MRKISMPGNLELALGAIAGPECKSQILNTELASLCGIEAATVEAPERAELVRRRNLQGARQQSDALKQSSLSITASPLGATMQVAIAAVRVDHPRRLVVATPVAAPDTMDRISRLANEVVCVTAAAAFSAVGLHCASFPQLSDAEVRSILDGARSGPLPTTRMP